MNKDFLEIISIDYFYEKNIKKTFKFHMKCMPIPSRSDERIFNNAQFPMYSEHFYLISL